MNAPNLTFDPDIVKLMGRVCDDVWRELRADSSSPSPSVEAELRRQIAQRVMAAVMDGEHDPARLRKLALQSVRV